MLTLPDAVSPSGAGSLPWRMNLEATVWVLGVLTAPWVAPVGRAPSPQASSLPPDTGRPPAPATRDCTPVPTSTVSSWLPRAPHPYGPYQSRLPLLRGRGNLAGHAFVKEYGQYFVWILGCLWYLSAFKN